MRESYGTIVARKAREMAQKITPEQRRRSIQEGMKMMYGTKTVKEARAKAKRMLDRQIQLMK